MDKSAVVRTPRSPAIWPAPVDPKATEAKTLRLHGVGDLRLRRLSPADGGPVNRLAHVVWSGVPSAAAAAIPALSSTRDGWRSGVSLGLFAPDTIADEPRLLGLAGLVVGDNADESGTFGVVVDPRYRGLGLGRRLVTEILACAQKAGFDSVRTRIKPDNLPMLALAHRLGFGRQRLFGDDPVLLHRRLPSLPAIARTPGEAERAGDRAALILSF